MNETERKRKFEIVFAENKDRIFRLCYSVIHDKNEADDLFQEVMMNVWKNMDSFRGDSEISTWIYRIAVNSAILFNKRKKRREEFSEPVDQERLNQFRDDFRENKLEYQEILKILYLCIGKLKPQDKIIISLLLEGMPHNEISEIVGITVNYVGVKFKRIKEVLGICIEEKDGK